MSKIVMMVTTETGWIRMGESDNGGETPRVACGWLNQESKTFDRASASEFNKALGALGYTMREARICEGRYAGKRASTWTHANGSMFVNIHVTRNEKLWMRTS